MDFLENITKPFVTLPSIVGLMADNAACGNYRIRFPLEFLKRGGARVNIVDKHLTEPPKEDVVIAQRQYDRDIFETLMELKEYGHTIIYEIDDNVHRVHPNSPAYTVYKPGSETCRGVERFIRGCDGLFVSSAELASQYRHLNNRIWVLPNQIDFGYRDWESPVERDPRLEGYTVIGWAGSITHQDDWQPLAGVLDRILDKYPNTIVALVSAYQTMEIFVEQLRLPSDRVVQLDPVAFPEYPKLPAQFDIGLVPVVTSPFNMAKCLDWKTRVSTPDGLLPIGSLTEGSKVWNGTEWVEVVATEQQSPKEGLRIRTRRGYELLMTPNHRIMTGSGWKRADELVIGTRVPLSSWRFSNNPVAVSFNTKEDSYNPSSELVLDETWGEILGLLVAGGDINDEEVYLSVDEQDSQTTEYIIDLFRKVGLNAESRRPGEINVCSDRFLDFLKYLGLIENGGCFLRVPEVIWRSPKSVVAAFLRGYFEVDSHCWRQTFIRAISKNADVLREIQELLLGFEITSSREVIGQYGNHLYTSLNLSLAEVRLFSKEIGYLSKKKRESFKAGSFSFQPSDYCSIQWEDEIVSIEPQLINPIDIQVPGQVFIAAGFISHNSDLKIIEYGARKVPYVASKLAPYVRFHEESSGQGGYIAGSVSEWVEAISQLVEDVEDRKRKSEFLFNYVRQERSYSTKVYLWAQAIQEAQDIKFHQADAKRQYVVPEKPGRNDPCPCGSGKKYKKCTHYGAWG